MNAALLTLLLPLVLLSAACSGSETALFSLNHADRVKLGRDHPRAARAVAVLLARPKQLLLTVLILNTTVNVSYFVISNVLIGGLEGPVLVVAFSVASLLVIILFGEVLAKLVAAAHRGTWCVVFARPVLLIDRGISPVRLAVDRFGLSPLYRLVSPRRTTQLALTAGELDALLEQGEHQGVIDAQEQDLLAAVVWLGQTRVRDVMTHRTEFQWLERDASRADVARLVAQTRRSRLLVRDASPEGAVLGLLDAARYFADLERSSANNELPALDRFIDAVDFLPDSASLDQALEYFRRAGAHVAVCVDEHGSVTGVIEIEDTVERLLPIAAEPDDDLQHEIRRLGTGRWSVPARLRAREWMEVAIGSEPANLDPRVSTLGGLVLASLGRVPEPGDRVRIGSVTIEVESVRGPAIIRLIVSIENNPVTGGAP